MDDTSLDRNLIEETLDQYVRPVLFSHGGDIRVQRIDSGILYFRLTGSCSGCPAADLTSEELINKELTERIPGLKKAVLESVVSEDLLSEARKILNDHNQKRRN